MEQEVVLWILRSRKDEIKKVAGNAERHLYSGGFQDQDLPYQKVIIGTGLNILEQLPPAVSVRLN